MNCSRISLSFVLVLVSVRFSYAQDPCQENPCLCPVQYYGNMGGSHWYYFLCCSTGTESYPPSDFRTLSSGGVDLGCAGAGQCNGSGCVSYRTVSYAGAARTAAGEVRIDHPIPLPNPIGNGTPIPELYSGPDIARGRIQPKPGATTFTIFKQFDRVVRLKGTDVYFRLACLTSYYQGTPLHLFLAIETDRVHKYIKDEYYSDGYYDDFGILEVDFKVDENGIKLNGAYNHYLEIEDATIALDGEISDRSTAFGVSYHNLSDIQGAPSGAQLPVRNASETTDP